MRAVRVSRACVQRAFSDMLEKMGSSRRQFQEAMKEAAADSSGQVCAPFSYSFIKGPLVALATVAFSWRLP
jgi:hypothetical protein